MREVLDTFKDFNTEYKHYLKEDVDKDKEYGKRDEVCAKGNGEEEKEE